MFDSRSSRFRYDNFIFFEIQKFLVFYTPPILTFPLDLTLLGEVILYDVFGPDPE